MVIWVLGFRRCGCCGSYQWRSMDEDSHFEMALLYPIVDMGFLQVYLCY